MSFEQATHSERHIAMAKHCRRYGHSDNVLYHEYFATAWLEAEKDGRANDPDFVPDPMPKPFVPVSIGYMQELDSGDGDDGDDPPTCWGCGAVTGAVDILCDSCSNNVEPFSEEEIAEDREERFLQ